MLHSRRVRRRFWMALGIMKLPRGPMGNAVKMVAPASTMPAAETNAEIMRPHLATARL